MQRGQLHQCRQPLGQDILLHPPDIAWPLLVFAYRDADDGFMVLSVIVPILTNYIRTARNDSADVD